MMEALSRIETKYIHSIGLSTQKRAVLIPLGHALSTIDILFLFVKNEMFVAKTT